MTARTRQDAPDWLTAINEAADAAFDANPGKPVSAAQAAQIRPLLPPAQAEREAA